MNIVVQAIFDFNRISLCVLDNFTSFTKLFLHWQDPIYLQVL